MLTEKVVELLNKTKKLIIEHNYDEAYEILSHSGLSTSNATSDYTLALLKSGINPLDYTSTVPYCYLIYCNDKSLDINIPEHIKEIEAAAFLYANIGTVYIPDNVDIHIFSFTKAKCNVICNQQQADVIKKKGIDTYDVKITVR